MLLFLLHFMYSTPKLPKSWSWNYTTEPMCYSISTNLYCRGKSNDCMIVNTNAIVLLTDKIQQNSLILCMSYTHSLLSHLIFSKQNRGNKQCCWTLVLWFHLMIYMCIYTSIYKYWLVLPYLLYMYLLFHMCQKN